MSHKHLMTTVTGRSSLVGCSWYVHRECIDHLLHNEDNDN